jgi:hypothetical protein
MASRFEMFTDEGGALVSRIASAARDLAGVDGPQNPTELALQWAERELDKLSRAEGFEEATDTAVREAVFSHVLA